MQAWAVWAEDGDSWLRWKKMGVYNLTFFFKKKKPSIPPWIDIKIMVQCKS